MAKPSAAVPARRRTQAERVQITQRKLIDAAIELLKKKRYVSFRTAEVAEAAGVSKGAQSHHFASKDMLVLQVLEEVYRRTQARALERIETARNRPGQLLELLATDSEEFFLGDDFLLSLDLMMIDPQSALGSAVKELAQRYRLPVEQAWIDTLVAAGHPREQAHDVVRLTYAIARGFGIRQLISGPEGEFKRLLATWMRMAEAMLLLAAPPGGAPANAPGATPAPRKRAPTRKAAEPSPGRRRRPT